MRYIVVDKQRAAEARKCAAQLVVDDVEVEIAQGTAPSNTQIAKFRSAETVYCISLRKKYCKVLARSGVNVVSLASIATAVVEITRPIKARLVAPKPSISLGKLAAEADNVLPAEQWAAMADEITERRWGFIQDAAFALAEYASNPSVANQGLDQFFGARKLAFATSGSIEATYRLLDQDGRVITSKSTKWHLKKGDKTTAEDAPRIYFDTERIEKELFLILLRAGPHPPDSFSVDVPFVA